MLKKYIFQSLIILVGIASSLQAHVEIPSQFFVKQHWISLTNTFDIETHDRKFGTIHRKLLSWTPEYQFFDVYDQLQAKAKMRFFSFGATFDIYDLFERPLGRVDERILTFFSTFDLYRSDGYHAAKAKLNFWGTKYTVSDPHTDAIIATLKRSFFRLKDDWTVDIIDSSLFFEKQIDPRMFILVMAFQTDRDYWKSKREREERGRHYSVQHLSKRTPEYLALNKKLEYQRSLLESYRENYQGLEPSDEEVENLEEIVEKILDEAEPDETNLEEDNLPSSSLELAKIQALDKGISTLLPLFESEELTKGEKSALFMLMDQRLQ
ncbi:MAG: hypothetical protein BGO14_06635 [Chlamydiales bacterium 38-26]|nr:hypothetical protein [Chlamydiales bacterium]OJV08554.1 MAG: hypothetical protein BGO14_06635 [Chlamydiales bacterium 38-26]